MTCILGLETLDGRTLLMADRRVVWGSTLLTDAHRKLERVGPWVVGFTGPTSWSNIVEAARAEIETAGDGHGVRRAVESAAKGSWAAEKETKVSMLFAGPGGLRLLSLGDGFWCMTQIEPGRVTGIGSGGEIGQGAAWLALRQGSGAEEALRVGLEAAIANDSGCGGEPQVEWAEKREGGGAAEPISVVANRLPPWLAFRGDGWPLCPRCGEDEVATNAERVGNGRGLGLVLAFGVESHCLACGWSSGPGSMAAGAGPPLAAGPWLGPNDGGETPGDICCQRASGQFCCEHNPAHYRWSGTCWELR